MLRKLLPHRENISRIVAKTPRSTRNTEEWQIGADRSGKYAAIRLYRATMNNLPTFVLLARILDVTVAKRFSRLDSDLVLTIERLLKDWETRLKN